MKLQPLLNCVPLSIFFILLYFCFSLSQYNSTEKLIEKSTRKERKTKTATLTAPTGSTTDQAFPQPQDISPSPSTSDLNMEDTGMLYNLFLGVAFELAIKFSDPEWIDALKSGFMNFGAEIIDASRFTHFKLPGSNMSQACRMSVLFSWTRINKTLR